MPLYEYKCDRCGAVFEKLQRFSDALLKVHEGCGGSVERLLSPPALQFKGSGFYITDYARGSNGKGEPKKKPESTAPAAKPESTGKSEPAAKS
jgi:putative FmdB family regulatory protein